MKNTKAISELRAIKSEFTVRLTVSITKMTVPTRNSGIMLTLRLSCKTYLKSLSIFVLPVQIYHFLYIFN